MPVTFTVADFIFWGICLVNISVRMVFQWNSKYGCKGTVTTRFALIALVAWQY